MAWSSFMAVSRQLGMSMRTRTPKTAFLKFSQYKRLIHEGKPPATPSEGYPTVAEVQEKVMGVLQPFGENVANLAKANADVAAVMVLVPTAILGSYYLWKNDPNDRSDEHEITTAQGSNPMGPAMASLLNNQTADQTANQNVTISPPEPCVQNQPEEPDSVPCVSCAVPCGADAQPAENKSFDASPLSVVGAALLTSSKPGEPLTNVMNIQQKAEQAGICIPMTVGQDTMQQPLTATTMENLVMPAVDADSTLPNSVIEEKANVDDKESATEKQQNAGGRRRRQRNPNEAAQE